MAEWKPACELDAFKHYVECLECFWYFTDEDKQQQGPVKIQELVKNFNCGIIDGMTMVWAQHMKSWQQVLEIPTLKTILQEFEQEETVAASMQASESVSGGGNGESGDETARSKSYTADDGTEYSWDDSSKDWIKSQLLAVDVPAVELDKEVKPQVCEAPLSEAEKQAALDLQEKRRRRNEKKKAAKKRKQEQWKQSKKQTWVYVTGLPDSVSEDELGEYFSKCGVLGVDASGKSKVKIYRSESGALKGDASIGYLKDASVDLAVQVLDGADFRPGCSLKVQPAKFEQKGKLFVAKKRKFSGAVKVAKSKQDAALSWNDGIDDGTGLKIIVVKGMFQPDDFRSPSFSDELQEDIQRECLNFGELDKVTIFDKNPEGVVVIKFTTATAAEQCMSSFDGRYFDGRQLECTYWDGETDYTIKEKAEDEDKRLDEFGDWLENQSSDDESDESDQPLQQESAEPIAPEMNSARVLPEWNEEDDDSA